MMGLTLLGAGYRYPSASTPAVAGVDLSVAPGEVVLLTGPTGCGKSTLLRLACGLLQRHGAGEVQGTVRLGSARVGEVDPGAAAPRERVGLLGFVGQEPGDQLVAGTVADEVAFAMESAGRPGPEIDAALPGLLAAVGLDVGLDRDPRSLSGGQTQRLVVAAALSAGAGVLVADEPVAQLDPAGAQALLAGLRTLARERGLAVLLVEHRLEACWPHVDRLAVMEAGALVADVPVADIAPGAPLLVTLRRLGLTVPGPLDLADRLGVAVEALPARLAAAPPPTPAAPPAAAPAPGPVRVAATDLRHRYRDAAEDAVSGVSLSLHDGERIALLGGNGAGKSTLLGRISGRLAPRGAGSLDVRGRVVGVPQDPDLALFSATVRDELAVGPREARVPDVAGVVQAAAEALSVADLLDRAPQALSRGQRLRVAVAAALSCRPDVLLLDEPTSGQDHDQVEQMMGALAGTLAGGLLLFATHDVDLALRHATRIVVLHEGRVVADGPPGEALRDLPEAVPLVLPPLAGLCRTAGRPPATAAALAARLAPPAADGEA